MIFKVNDCNFLKMYILTVIYIYSSKYFKGADHAGTFISLKMRVFYFSYREFHEFHTKTININDMFSTDEK